MTPQETEILAINQKLLDSILRCDWNEYAELCHPTLTAFEPESVGHLVEGMPFHKYYFDLFKSHTGPSKPIQATMSQPHIRICGDMAVLSYVRLTQRINSETPSTAAAEETRIWQKFDGKWKHVHFHRSPIG